jgi:RNA polymerase sigma-70 factor (ECF subfamily)
MGETDQDIIARVLAGQRDVYAILVERHQNRLYKLALLLTGHPQDAEDLAQETLIRAYRSLVRYDPARPFFPWVSSILTNLARTRRRQKRPDMFPLSDQPPETLACQAPGPDTRLARMAEWETLVRALNRLPERLREALVLRHIEDLPFDHVARVLGISEAAAKMRVARGLEKLKKIMEDGPA